jgi:signal transduction histidine kinase
MRLRTKLLALLLAFGVLPCGVSIVVGYSVSRAIITRQAERALRELTVQQALHLAAEVSRERLLLRTIAGRLPPARVLARTLPAMQARELVQSLPEGGVFDGLRLVTPRGGVLASVSLRNVAPRWPPSIPSADWTRTPVAVHREGARVLAYVVAVPVTGSTVSAWLEGHVRAEDFRRVLAMPEHLMAGVESAVFERTGEPVLVGHEHAAIDVTAAFAAPEGDSAKVARAVVNDTLSLVVSAPITATDWVLVSVLPLQVALAPLARLRDTAVAGAGALVLVIVFAGVLAARSVTTPLHDLAEAASRLGREGTYSPLQPHRADEVGQLVAAFNRMGEDLAESRKKIEQLHADEMARAQQLATVGELASGVAHEIRNPVTAVLGALDLVLRRLPVADASRPLLEQAQQQLKRIQATTTQLLRYARPPELRAVVVDANLLVDRAARVVEGQARNARVDLHTEPAGEALPVSVDPELMVQVLVNLILNGIEAMTSGGRLTIWVTRHAPEVWIGVRDTGPGVPAEKRAEIFRPFYTTKHQGTGLGLSISQQIVTRHGGTLRVEDTPGGGATFVVALPLAEERGTGRGHA